VAYALAKWVRGVFPGRYAGLEPKDSSPSAGSTLLIITPDTKSAESLFIDLEFFHAGADAAPVLLFTGWEILPFEPLSPTAEIVSNRIAVLDRLRRGEPCIVIAAAEALTQKILRPDLLRAATIELSVNDTVERDEFIAALDVLGYQRTTLTEELGQFSVRGAIIDIFPAGAKNPVRLEFFGDLLESIREFDAETQRSLTPARSVRVLPICEHLFPWRISECALGRDFTLAPDESLENAIQRVRDRAEVSVTPTREVDLLEDVLRTGGYWPGIEQLTPLLQSPTAAFWDYLPPTASVVAVDEFGIDRTLSLFDEMVDERAQRAVESGQVIPEANDSFLSSSIAPDLIYGQIRRRLALAFNALELVRFDEPSEIPFEGEADPTPKLDIVPNSDLLVRLKQARQTELPFKVLADEIILRRSQGFEIAIAVSHPPKARRFRELLETYEIVAHDEPGTFQDWFARAAERRREMRITTKSPVALLHGSLTGGVRVLRDAILVLADHEIFPEISLRRPSRSANQARRILGASGQIREDDYVVHVDHGVAIYRGLKQMTVGDHASDFLQLEYAEGAKLFVPVENIGKVQKYVGADGKKPALNKLGGKNWSQTKEKVRKNIQELAGQLLSLYAQREMSRGFAFGAVNEEDLRFADTFPYQETPDQEKAITEVLTDMGSERPMDRLVCGDVGYGKTEVALRAAFKAVNSGKQVAILVPTTILADQHFNTFRERLSEFGFEIASVSRFNSPAENRKNLEGLAAGRVDVIVGTHRLLQKDVYFKELGLVIIDEEHRFGVTDKERLKKLRADVDVLTLTATPIPRTLHMSLLSIRDLSVIETPPTNRQVIQTYFANYREGVVREAILRELGRSGQVFYIHNRVHNIELIADELRSIVPEARIEFAHGQMREDELENVMHRFIAHEFDVLVSTTIVESGLDIPNANTIIIREGDKLGLAELYQLRGRVGRSSRRAYAYLLVPDARTLGPDAKKRLEVLQALDDLGMGFRLALQDMEIRGAGNLLGRDQSGKIELVGFDLYSRILKEAVRELQSRRTEGALPPEILIDPEANIGFAAHIPHFFIPDVEERVLLYQRLVELRDDKEALDLADEIRDRFGHPPKEVDILLELMVFRSVLRRGGIVAASRRGTTLTLTFHKDARIDTVKLTGLIGRSAGKLKLTGPLKLSLALENEPETPFDLTKKVRALVELVHPDIL